MTKGRRYYTKRNFEGWPDEWLAKELVGPGESIERETIFRKSPDETALYAEIEFAQGDQGWVRAIFEKRGEGDFHLEEDLLDGGDEMEISGLGTSEVGVDVSGNTGPWRRVTFPSQISRQTLERFENDVAWGDAATIWEEA